MASDKQQFNEAMAAWNSLHESGNYSVPTDVGRVAIICTYSANLCSDESESLAPREERDIKIFRKEAFALAENIETSGQDTVTIFGANANDMNDVLRDPTISDVVLIGHGTLSFIIMPNGNDTQYDWQDVSKAADHLKTGVFVQRHCGLFRRNVSVPLGAFCMADHSNVVAPVGRYFAPKGLLHPHNALLTRVTRESALTYAYIKGDLKKLNTHTS